MQHGVVEQVLQAGEFAKDRVAADMEPRVVDHAEPVLHPVDGHHAALLVTGRDRGPSGEQPVCGLVPRPVRPVVEGIAAFGEFHRVSELAVMRHDVGEVVRTASLNVDVIDGVGQFGGRGDVVPGEVKATRGRFNPRGEQQGVGPVPGRRGVAGGGECGQDPFCTSAVAQDNPGPPEPVRDAHREPRVVRGAPGQRGVDVGAFGAGEGQVLGLPATAHTLGGWIGGLCEPCGVRRIRVVVQPGVGHFLASERPDAVQQPVAH